MHSSQTGPWSRFLIYAASTVLLAAPSLGQDTPPRVALETSHGTIVLELNPEKAPITVENFLDYVERGWYDGTIFHRVMDGFMIQGGGFDTSMQKKITRPPIKNEAGNGLSNDRGTVAMARTGEPDSATAQFYINLADNDFLNREEAQDGVGYAVFGKVVEGMDAVDAIAKVKVNEPGRLSNAQPVETVVIKSIKRE
ncbi:MAG: peptidyl-prolyl cis-trans isomerase [Holophagales bacterium]|nr:peptidyl-prolyl cis-trans isomerase [Holophagales bacterium]MYF94889.1 peptidyl-prolyl cis-trans isomerase [Holophagales bacterium]